MVAIIFALVYTAEGWIYKDYNLDIFQIATGYLKDRDPTLFSSDFIWSKSEMIRNLHVCVRNLLGFTEVLTGGMTQEPIDLHLIWLPVMVVVFFLGIYLLCEHFTKSHWASLLVACSFMLVRRSIWDWWGIGPIFTLSARGPVLAFIPLALWGYFRCRENLFKLACFFLLWGFVSNLHPLSGWGFVEFLGIAILLRDRFSWDAWRKAATMGIATLLGSLPFILIWTRVVVIPEAIKASPEVIAKFWDNFAGLEAPNPKYVMNILEDIALPFFLAVVGWRYWRAKIVNRRLQPGQPGIPEHLSGGPSRGLQDPTISSRSHDSSISGDSCSSEVKILYLFPVVAILMTILVIVVGGWLRALGFSLPVMFPEHGRNIKMVYLTLPVWMAWGFLFTHEKLARSRRGVRRGILGLMVVVLLAINFPGHKLLRYGLWKAGVWGGSELQRMEEKLDEDRQDWEVAHWAREHTATDALFYFDSYEFRYYARRSLVFCWFDRPCVGYRPTKDLEEWIRRRDRVKALKDASDSEGMLKAAREYGADFLVTLKIWPRLAGEEVWSNQKYRIYRVKSKSS
jgi:hypothetical protein